MDTSSEEELVEFAKGVLAAFGTTFGLEVKTMIGHGKPRLHSVAILGDPSKTNVYPFPLYGGTLRHVRHMNPALRKLVQDGVTLQRS